MGVRIEVIRRRLGVSAAALVLGVGAAGVAGCGEDDLSDAGDEIENTADDAANEAEDAANEAGNAAEDAAGDVKEAGEDAGNDIDKAVGGEDGK